jgi:dihydroneopterin triphosphate diphosphatase
VLEETRFDGPLYRLDSMATVPVEGFAARDEWPSSLYVVPEYAFAVETVKDPTLSPEHSGFCWASYYEAHDLLRWDTNRTALWELRERLARADLPPS